MLQADVAAGKLPPLAQRLPQTPLVLDIKRPDWSPGRYGGDLRTLVAKDRDIRTMVVYGYSRLVGYDENLRLVPDILERVDNVGDRVFTLHLRRGHKWSDGHPFTTADFRYFWEDVANNPELSRFGLPQILQVGGRGPRFEVLDDTTVRFSWDEPNPQFLPALAGPSPLYIYRPAHYLRQFHPRYVGLEKANAVAVAAGSRNWAGYHQKQDEQYRFDNPDLPTLEPWINTTPLPSTRFVLVRNPYFHRVDAQGRQLPYIDRVIVGVTDDKLIPAKAGAGDVDLQARYLRFDNYTFLKQGERQNGYRVLLWEKALGSQIALYPNLNVEDPEWRRLMRDVRFRRALSLAINRHEINQVVFFGLGREAGNTVVPRSPLYRPEFRSAWSGYDVKSANALLDAIGLTKRDASGLRLPARRPAHGAHHRQRRREHRGDRRPRADPRQLAAHRRQDVLAPVGARGVPQAGVLRQGDDGGMVRAEQRHPDALDEPARACPHHAGPAAMAHVGAVLRAEPQGWRGSFAARSRGTGSPLRAVAQLGDRSGP